MLSSKLLPFLVLPYIAAAFVSPASQVPSRRIISPLGPTATNGISYEDIQVGDGESVASGSQVAIHYTGTYVDKSGKNVEFENSRNTKVNKGVMGAMEGMPIMFPIGKGKVIVGWEQGILGNDEITAMKVGGQRKLVIPSDLAYGTEGRGVIPGDQELIFDVELVSVKKELFYNKIFFIAVPAVFGFLILNSIYMVLTGQA